MTQDGASSRRLDRRANATLALKLVAAATTYGFMLMLTRAMTLDGFGAVAVFLNCALFMSIVGARGQQLAILRFLPPLAASQDFPGIRRFVLDAARRATVMTLVLTGLIAALANWLPTSAANPALAGSLLVPGLLLIPLVAWLDFQSHLARGFHLINIAVVPRDILWRAGVAMVVYWHFTTNDRSPVSPEFVLYALLAGLVVLAIAQAFAIVRSVGLANLAGVGPSRADTSWRTSETAFWVSSVSNVFLANVGVIAVGLLSGPASAALYFAANRLALMMDLVLTSTYMVLGPMLSQAWFSGDPHRAEKLLHRATLRTALPAAILAFALIAGAPLLLRLFGDSYSQAGNTLRLLAIAGLINAALGPAAIALNMCGEHRAAMRASLLALTSSTAFLFIGVALGGPEGAALGVVFATIVRKALYWEACRTRLGLRTDLISALRRQAGTTVARPS